MWMLFVYLLVTQRQQPFPSNNPVFLNAKKRVDSTMIGSTKYEISRVLCTEKKIGLELPGKQFFGARIFASRHEDDPDCVRHYASTDKLARFELPTRDLPCGMKSKRLSYPKSGLEYTLDVIVSYSHMHMTQDDQMFSLTCRSTALSIPVGTVMEISTYSTTYLTDEPKVPTCEYSLHLGSIHGPIATNAQLGNKVFHEWKCNTENFAIKIYECYVHDGGNRRYLIIDEHGCSVDESIMPQLTYDANLNFVYVHSRVFKFSDSSKVLFKCLIYMCPKKDPRCKQTIPPQCNDRSKRFINETSSEDSTPIYNSVEIEADPFEDPSQSNLRIITSANQTIFARRENENCDYYTQTTIIVLIFTNFLTLSILAIISKNLWANVFIKLKLVNGK